MFRDILVVYDTFKNAENTIHLFEYSECSTFHT